MCLATLDLTRDLFAFSQNRGRVPSAPYKHCLHCRDKLGPASALPWLSAPSTSSDQSAACASKVGSGAGTEQPFGPIHKHPSAFCLTSRLEDRPLVSTHVEVTTWQSHRERPQPGCDGLQHRASLWDPSTTWSCFMRVNPPQQSALVFRVLSSRHCPKLMGTGKLASPAHFCCPRPRYAGCRHWGCGYPPCVG